MYIVCGTWRDALGQYLAARFGGRAEFTIDTTYTVIGFISKRIDCIALFTDYTGSNIELHLVSEGGLNRTIMKTVGNYVFNQLKCNRLTVKTRVSKSAVTDIYDKVGFKYEATLKNYYGSNQVEDALQYVLTREDAVKWIKLDG